MKKVNGFLYDHYDSRGGTMMIVTDNREKADEFYNLNIFDMDPEDVSDFGGISDEDFLCKAELHFPDDVDLPMDRDLEDDIGGRVIRTGTNTREDWPEWNHIYCEERNFLEEFEFDKDHIKVLEFVPENKEPVMFVNGWDWPRWDDDAYSFAIRKI